MKKIAVVTFLFDNYGTKLQAYALCKVLQDAGHDVEALDFDLEMNEGARHKDIFKDIYRQYGIIKGIPHMVEKIRWAYGIKKMNARDHSEEKNHRRNKFENFTTKYIPYSKHYTSNELREGKCEHYDVFITGSDQVWNYQYVSGLDIFFLNFVSDGSKKLSYAASFGFTSLPKEKTKEYECRIEELDSVLVREKEALDIAHNLGRADAKLVLDPTLLIDSKSWDSVINVDNVANLLPDEYILVYSLNQSYKIYKEAISLADKVGKKVVVLKRSFCPPELDNVVALYDVGVEEFLWLIKNASCVITNSYHALLFSINFNTKFYAYLDRAEQVNSRLISIIDIVNIKGRVYYEEEHIPKTLGCIDYNECNKILMSERTESLRLLYNSIECLAVRDFDNLQIVNNLKQSMDGGG